MQLYGVRGWGSAITETMLVAAGQTYEFVDVEGFDHPGAARERLCAVNPLGQVPALVCDDGTVLTETAAIALHLAEVAPHARLAPEVGSPERATFLRLLVWLVANVYPTFTYGDYPQRWTATGAAELRAATDAARERLYLWLEQQVVGPFVLGSFSALDVYVAMLTVWRPRAGWFAAHAPKLAAIGAGVRAMPLLAAVLARNTPDETTA